MKHTSRQTRADYDARLAEIREAAGGPRHLPQEADRHPVTCFLPAGRSGRSCFAIYAVRVVDHAEAVKVGRTTSWANRQKAYANWNLRLGDGIAEQRVFLIADEYVDLPALEAAVLDSVRSQFEPYRALEWFKADDIDDVCRVIDEVITVGGLSYSME